MAYLFDVWLFLRTWGSVLGLAFDILGAILVYNGIRISLAEALKLEKPVVPISIYDIGGEMLDHEAKKAAISRANERLRAKHWSFAGLVCFVLGFSLQGIASWPK